MTAPNLSLDIWADFYIFCDLVTKLKLFSTSYSVQDFIVAFDKNFLERFEDFQRKALYTLQYDIYDSNIIRFPLYANFINKIDTIRKLEKSALFLILSIPERDKYQFAILDTKNGIKKIQLNSGFANAKIFLEKFLPLNIEIYKKKNKPLTRAYSEWLNILKLNTTNFLSTLNGVAKYRRYLKSRSPAFKVYNFQKEKSCFFTKDPLGRKLMDKELGIRVGIIPEVCENFLLEQRVGFWFANLDQLIVKDEPESEVEISP
jgi:hypothetical protein